MSHRLSPSRTRCITRDGLAGAAATAPGCPPAENRPPPPVRVSGSGEVQRGTPWAGRARDIAQGGRYGAIAAAGTAAHRTAPMSAALAGAARVIAPTRAAATACTPE